MVNTRSKTTAAAPNKAPDIVFQTTNQSLLAWSTGSRKTTESGSSRKPQTALLLKLPLDVLAIISSACHPLSILQLSRTCINLKLFFTSKASKPVWISSRKNLTFTIREEEAKAVGHPSTFGTFRLPNPPSSLSEAEYAAFCFETTCGVGLIAARLLQPANITAPCSHQQYCHEQQGSPCTGSLIVRACPRCLFSFVCRQDLQAEWREDVDPRLYRILPSIKDGRHKRQPRINEKAYHKPTCQKIFERTFLSEIAVKYDDKAMNLFYERGEEMIKEREALQRAFSDYEAAEPVFFEVLQNARMRQERERFKRNKLFVTTRFEEEGRQIFHTDIEDCREALRIIQNLDDDLSDKRFAAIENDLIDCLYPIQVKRRCVEAYHNPEKSRITAMLNDFRLTLPEINGLSHRIRLADFIELPTCKSLASNADFTQGAADAKTIIWSASMSSVVEDINAWVEEVEESILIQMEEVRKHLLQYASRRKRKRYIYDVPLSRSYLRMPFAKFLCSRCRVKISTMSDILVHGCFGTCFPEHLVHTRTRLREAGVSTLGSYSTPVSFELLKIDWGVTFVGECIYDAIVKAGDVAPSTPAELLSKTGILRCSQCPSGSSERNGTTVALSYAEHSGPASDYYSSAKTHHKFKYIPSAQEVVEETVIESDLPPLVEEQPSLHSEDEDDEGIPQDLLNPIDAWIEDLLDA